MSDTTQTGKIAIEKRDRERLQRIAHALDQLKDLAATITSTELHENRALLLAVVKLIDVVSALAGKIKRSSKRKLPDIPWNFLFGARKTLGRQQLDFDVELVCQIHSEMRADVEPAIKEALASTYSIDETEDLDEEERKQMLGFSNKGFIGDNSTSVTIFDVESLSRKKLPDKFSRNLSSRLCLSDDPAIALLRAEMDIWYRYLSPRDQKTLHPRLMADENSAHLSAFYELFFHQYLLEKGWKVTKDPLYGDAMPDFHVHVDGFGELIIEAFSVFETRDIEGSVAEFHNLLKRIERFRFDFILSVQMSRWCENLELDPLEDCIYDWLSSLREDDGEQFNLEISNRFGFSGTIAATRATSTVAGGPVYQWSTPLLPIGRVAGNSLRSKCQKYKFLKEQNIPFVPAACLNDHMILDEVDICRQLYGNVNIQARSDKIELRLDQKHSEQAFFQPDRSTRVSAVLVCLRRWCETHMQYDIRIFHNPWARLPIHSSLFKEHPQLVTGKDFVDTRTMRWQDPEQQYLSPGSRFAALRT